MVPAIIVAEKRKKFREVFLSAVFLLGLSFATLHFVENCVVYGDRGYRGCEGVIVCDSIDMRAKRQVVECVISQIKLFNAGSG